MPNQRMRCSIAHHKLQGDGVRITNPQLIDFVKTVYPDFRPQEKVCRECKKFLEIIFAYKLRRQIRKRRRASLSSSSNNNSQNTTSSDSSVSLANLIHTAQMVGENSNSQSQSSTTDRSDSDQPTTSRAANERKRRRLETSSQNLIVLPHIQPRVRQRDFTTIHPEVLQNYLKGILGG